MYILKIKDFCGFRRDPHCPETTDDPAPKPIPFDRREVRLWR